MVMDTSRDLALVTNATVALRVTEGTLDTYWKRHVIPQAVDYLIFTTCFGWRPDKEGDPKWQAQLYDLMDAVAADPSDADAVRNLRAEINQDHRACFKLWLNDGPQGFYCLGKCNRCVNCGAEWVGVINADWQTGKLIKGQCPRCGEEFTPLFGQRAMWREQIASTIGDQLKVFRDTTKTVNVGMLFRLTGLYIEAGIVQLGSTYGTHEAAQYHIRQELKDKGFEGTDAYDAVNWTVFGQKGIEALGLDWTEAQAWTSRTKRERVPVIMAAAKRVLNGGTLDKEQIAKVLKRAGDNPRQAWEHVGQIANRIPSPGTPKPAASYQRHVRADAVVLHDETHLDQSFLLLHGTAEDMAIVRQAISDHVIVEREVDVTIPYEWIADEVVVVTEEPLPRF